MNFLKNLKIGYVPYSSDLSHPGDRRRFVNYAKVRRINFEVTSNNPDYDIIILSEAADYSFWLKNKNNETKYIFEFIDSYLAVSPYEIKGLARGTAKYLSGQSQYFRPNYWKTLREMCSNSDVVICTTDEQEQAIQPYCKNVYQVLDFHDEVLSRTKGDYSKGPVFNLVWEGFASNLYPFDEIKEILNELDKKTPLALHLITEKEYYRYLNSYGRVKTLDKIKNIFKNSYVYQWDIDNFSNAVIGYDAAIIPIDLDYPLMKGKPENKLISFLKLGLPVLTSATPSHTRLADKSGLDLVCYNQQDWLYKLDRLINDDTYRESSAIKARQFVEEEYHSDKLIEQWDNIFINHFS